ncbi:MAG: preprotein translocase subunit SecG [Alphaproteobacteria bacterium]
MINVILALHLMVAVALVGMVLMQRSEGGALGMGGGSGSMISGRGAANVLVRGTGILGAVFFITSISLTMLAGGARAPKSVVDTPASSPLAPIVEMFDRVIHPAAKPSIQPAPTITLPAPAAPSPIAAAPPRGEVAPAPESVAQRAAPLTEVLPTAAPKAGALAPAVASKPVVSAAPKPAVVAAPKPSTSPAAVAAKPPVQLAIPTPLTSVKPAESSEPQVPAEKPRGRAGPDE